MKTGTRAVSNSPADAGSDRILSTHRHGPQTAGGQAEKMRNALLLVLLLVSEGFMGQVHSVDLDLAALSHQANYIVIAKKAKPFSKIVKMPLDATKKHKPFQSHRYAYKVIEVLKTASDGNAKAGAKISVRPAHDATFFYLEQRYALEGVSKSPILETYQGGTREKEERDTVILFLNDKDKETATYQVSAFRAFESPEVKAAVLEAASAPDPDKPKPSIK